MSQQRHVIKHLILDLQLASQQGAFELQTEISQICRDRLVPLMDDLFSQFSDSDMIHRIDTLELDLGEIEVERLERSLVEQTIQHLSQQLDTTVAQGGDSSIVPNGVVEPRSPEFVSPNSSQTDASPTQSNLELVTYFLQTGTLPWWATQLSTSDLETRFQALLLQSPDVIEQLLFSPDDRPLKRLIYHFADESLLKVAQWLAPNVSLSFVRNSQILSGTQPEDRIVEVPHSQYRLRYWKGLLYSVFGRQGIPFDETAVLQDIQRYVANHPLASPTDSEVQQFGDRVNPAHEFYIANAGLIILWPFLERFFKAIKLIEMRNFKTLAAAERAVLILQYLVRSSAKISESDLPLNKVLCGFNPFEPLPINFDPTELEIAECETLLSAVIQHWSNLRNTSITGLQQLFLQRSGVLRVRDGCWLLQVEQAVHDALLDDIPWSIRVVKLPWEKETIYVEW